MFFDKSTSLRSTFSVNGETDDGDTRFLNVTIDVLHTGDNLNKSFFDKGVVDKCVDSIKNTPVLGFIKKDEITKEKDFKGHEYEITVTEDGVDQVYIGRAFGVIPESCNPRWIFKMCDDGVEREFLQVDALMWEKFSDATGIMKRDSEKPESMELDVTSIEGEEDENGIFHFTKFKFDGACILGDGVQPAMIDANVRINDSNFSIDSFSKAIQSELNEKFTAFTKIIDNDKQQGGVGNMPNNDFAMSVMQQFEEVSRIVKDYATTKNTWGEEVPRYYAVDVQDNEVIVVDKEDGYRYYGFAFTMNGDKPEIDFACKSRKKVRYEAYEEGTDGLAGAFNFGAHIADIEHKASEKVAEVEAQKNSIETECTQVKEELDDIKPKYDQYVADEKKREEDAVNAEKDAKFAEYEDLLSENADFAALKEKKAELSVDEIEKECAVMYVKASRAKSSFSKANQGSAVVGIMSDDNDDRMDEYAHTRYGDIKINR